MTVLHNLFLILWLSFLCRTVQQLFYMYLELFMVMQKTESQFVLDLTELSIILKSSFFTFVLIFLRLWN